MTTMTRHAIRSAEAPEPAGPYSQGVVSNGLFFTAGFGPRKPASGESPAGVGEQTRQVLRSIASVLEAAGLSMDDVVKSTVHLQDLQRDFAEFNAAYSEFFTEPYPVRTTVGSTLNGILVEIDVVASLPS